MKHFLHWLTTHLLHLLHVAPSPAVGVFVGRARTRDAVRTAAKSKKATIADKEQPWLQEWCAKYGMKPDHLGNLGIVRLSKDETSAVLGYSAPASGCLIPYFDIDGNKTNFFRIRLDDYTDSWAKLTSRKELRYLQPKSSGIAIYFDPTLQWRAIAADTSKALLITEGEMKAACAVAYGFVCIGLGGVASWRGTKEDGHLLHTQLRDINWRDREVYIVYDSDAATNPWVRQQERRLATTLTRAGAKVKIARIPQEVANVQ